MAASNVDTIMTAIDRKARRMVDAGTRDAEGIKINFVYKKNINSLAQLFNGGESEVKVVQGCNSHDGTISRVQEGDFFFLSLFNTSTLILLLPLCVHFVASTAASFAKESSSQAVPPVSHHPLG
eukprot:scaffold1837_cov120-Skeletonema_dohrnii-CCMP3373.AAC.6